MATFEDLESDIILTSDPVENNIADQKWHAWENEMNLKVPNEYKKFINEYGTGRLGELIWILNPFAKVPRFNLESFLETKADAFAYMESELERKSEYSVYNQGSGIVPFAFTDNGDGIYWNVHKEDRGNWPIIVMDGRSPVNESYDFDFVNFLYKVLNRQLNSKILHPDDIKNKNFDPLPNELRK
jgi:hypothetical protein